MLVVATSAAPGLFCCASRRAPLDAGAKEEDGEALRTGGTPPTKGARYDEGLEEEEEETAASATAAAAARARAHRPPLPPLPPLPLPPSPPRRLEGGLLEPCSWGRRRRLSIGCGGGGGWR